MVLHDWQVSRIDGRQSLRLSGQGIWLGEEIKPWSDLTDVAFVRYRPGRGTSEEFWLWFGPQDRRRLRWTSAGGERAAWGAMLVDFAAHAARHRPDLTLRDGPDAADLRMASRIGLGVAALALTIMVAVLLSGPTLGLGLTAGWIGVVGAGVGLAMRHFYNRRGEVPRLDWASFAAREGQAEQLPAN
ncbi:hypothetical protein [Roseicyclus mahoneyensis]|uniref:Uncharacterized protein n=1 Tax=Roseicyclus mahoneyensis TaxID=164332 RepID=A0A316GQ83_9RHOB|nr:hypothetical protein [Roseicyclus mahoneyensis]PWK62879.1 hypothetical protein C7455_101918 [Roseicyclus mahoneyensis]